MEKNNLLLEVKGLKKYFPLQKNLFGKPKFQLRAVDDVSFTLEKGKTIGVVGESGCGKTTLGRTILQLYDTTGGKTLYHGHTVFEFAPKYFLDAINNLGNTASKFNHLKISLATYGYDVNNYLLADYQNEINKLDEELKIIDKETNKELYPKTLRILTIFKEIYELLINISALCGGAILLDIHEIKSLLIEKVKLSKAYHKEASDELANKINEINAKIAVLKASQKDDKLFNELDSNFEIGLNLALLKKEEMRSLRTEIQLIFQDPYSSLPPRMTIGAILTEAVQVHHIVPKDKIKEHIRLIMKKCGLQPQYYDRYPHEFSGGQRQRICIARALAVNPKLVICDEPVSALDVSIQAQIINLLKELQNELGLTYMFISHDLSVVKYITDSIIVMYLGNMMEIGETKDIFKNPLHPYTQALFSAVPVPDPDAKMERIILKGDIPSPANPPKGCKFHTRCEKCMSVCELKAPKFIEAMPNHRVACHLYDEEIMAELAKYDEILEDLKEKEANHE